MKDPFERFRFSVWLGIALLLFACDAHAGKKKLPVDAALEAVRVDDVEQVTRTLERRLGKGLVPECYIAARQTCDHDETDRDYALCQEEELKKVRGSGTLEHDSCLQRGDLDADGKSDLVFTVRRTESCGSNEDAREEWPDGCQRGVAILWGSGGGALLGAGERPALKAADVGRKDDGTFEKPDYEETKVHDDLGFLRALWVIDSKNVVDGEVRRPGGRFPCAAGVPFTRDVLWVSGGDAAVVWFLDEGAWYEHHCGF